jgi:ribose transport system substrate-binding protein
MKLRARLARSLALAVGLTIATSAMAKDITLAIMPVGMDTFGVAVGRGFKAEAESLGARAIVVDSKWSADTMGNGIDDLIAQGVSGIAIAPVDGIVAMSWVDKLVGLKIPVLAVTTAVGDLTKQAPTAVYPGLVAYVNHDDTVSGALSAQMVIPFLPKDRKAKIAVVNGSPGIAIIPLRLSGFFKALDAAGVKYEIVADQPTDWSPEKAEAVCQNILTATPDVDLFFAMADPLAIGCSHAVKETKSHAKIVSTSGGMKVTLGEIAAGNIIGTVCVKPETMGRLAAKALYEAATNPKAVLGKYIGYDLIKATKDTLADCVPEW